MTTKKKYEKPSMQVFELQQQARLLAGSEKLQDYDWNDYQEE